MLLSPLEQINNLASTDKKPDQEALQQAAKQFEAILLMQLTSALNGAGDSSGQDDGDSLFGSDGGTDMAKKMFSEQLATTMSESGGVGLADMMIQKFGVNPKPAAGGKNHLLTKTISAVRDIRENVSAARRSAPVFLENAPTAPLTAPEMINNQIIPEENSQFMPDYAPSGANQGGRFIDVDNSSTSRNLGEAEIVSTFEDEVRADGIDDSLKNLMLDGKVANSTRARIVPNEPVSEDKAQISAAENSTSAGGSIDYEMPVKARISSNFGMRFHPIDKVMKFHAGLDLAVPIGTPVSAAAAGIVTFAGRKDGYGNVVIVQHADGRETRYGHLSKIIVSENEQVAGGQQIALSGTTGKSTGPHLHFEVRENGEAVNPLKLVPKVIR